MDADPITQLRVDGAPSLAHIDRHALDHHRFPDGSGFPESYRSFVRRAGWGRTFRLWLISPPVLSGYADGWHGRAGQLTSTFLTSYREGRTEEFDWMVEPDGNWTLPESLHVFGWSENGDALLWDIASRGPDGEFPIWESRSLDSLHHLGNSLHEALPIVRARASSLFGPLTYDVDPLSPTRL